MYHSHSIRPSSLITDVGRTGTLEKSQRAIEQFKQTPLLSRNLTHIESWRRLSRSQHAVGHRQRLLMRDLTADGGRAWGKKKEGRRFRRQTDHKRWILHIRIKKGVKHALEVTQERDTGTPTWWGGITQARPLDIRREKQ